MSRLTPDSGNRHSTPDGARSAALSELSGDADRIGTDVAVADSESPAAVAHSESPAAVAASLDIVGERWSLLIVREAFLGARRFEEFQQRLGIARNMLATRLRTLVAAKVLNKRKYQDKPERFEYRLTQRGAELLPVLLALDTWGTKYLKAARTEFRHIPCGSVTASETVCADCHQVITPFDMALVEPPAAVSE